MKSLRQTTDTVLQKYQTENQLCNKFIQYMKDQGYRCYPEQGGWDILCVGSDSQQYGIQAKLTASYEALIQCIPDLHHGHMDKESPDFRVCLISRFPRKKGFQQRFMKLARNLKIIVIRPDNFGGFWGNVDQFGSGFMFGVKGAFYYLKPAKRVWVPHFIPDLPAGVPSPKTVSKWKIIAVALDRLYLGQKWVCLKDVRDLMDLYDAHFKPHSILNVYFKCTGEKVPKSQQCKWVRSAGGFLSDLFPEAAQK